MIVFLDSPLPGCQSPDSHSRVAESRREKVSQRLPVLSKPRWPCPHYLVRTREALITSALLRRSNCLQPLSLPHFIISFYLSFRISWWRFLLYEWCLLLSTYWKCSSQNSTIDELFKMVLFARDLLKFKVTLETMGKDPELKITVAMLTLLDWARLDWSGMGLKIGLQDFRKFSLDHPCQIISFWLRLWFNNSLPHPSLSLPQRRFAANLLKLLLKCPLLDSPFCHDSKTEI